MKSLQVHFISLLEEVNGNEEEKLKKKIMAGNEELLEEVNGNGDSFGMVKQRFKGRSQVLSNVELSFLLVFAFFFLLC